jgi:hypothetical protein
MMIEDDTVIFQSVPLIYERERDGEKPNTTRIIEAEEWTRLIGNYPQRIKIFSNIHNSQHFFERKITNISQLWQMFDKVVVTISWQHVTEEAQDEKG